MLSRFLSLLCAFCILLTLFCIPVFAASYNYSITFMDGEGYVAFVDSVPGPGTVSYTITCSSLDVPGFSLTSSGVGVLTSVEFEPGFYAYILGFIFDGSNQPLELIFLLADGLSCVGINTEDVSNLDHSLVFDVSISTFESPAFEESTGNGLLTGLSWIGSVVNALINGVLSPLLGLISVAVAITFILVVCKIIRYLSWGS